MEEDRKKGKGKGKERRLASYHPSPVPDHSVTSLSLQ